MRRRTKIIATVGPASATVQQLTALIQSGVDVFRLNFSHNTFDEHARLIRNIARAAQKTGRRPGIMQDLPGTKVRVAHLEAPLLLPEGTKVTIALGRAKYIGATFAVTSPLVAAALKPADPILIDDGLIRLRVKHVTAHAATCRVEVGGVLQPGKGVNFPSSTWQASALTAADRKALLFGLDYNLDYVALSFVADEKSVLAARRMLSKHGSHARVIAKIERPVAMSHLDRIIDAADGVMVARGDLAIEASLERVPFLQKDIINRAHKGRAVVIVATQMLESMTVHALPTRAEVSDVANAVLDGSDVVMLSAETAVGKYPVDTVRMMDRIIREAESQPGRSGTNRAVRRVSPGNVGEVIIHAAVTAADDFDRDKIIIYTRSGRTARLLSKYRPAADIYAFTPSEQVMRQMQLEWGVQPFFMKPAASHRALERSLLRFLKKRHLLSHDDHVIFILDTPGKGDTQAALRLMRVG